MTKFIALIAATASLFTLIATARAGSCCAAVSTPATESKAPMATVQSLPVPLPATLDNYSKIQAALAGDDLAGAVAAAESLVKILADDPNKTLPAALTSATAIQKATKLDAARAAFKELSTALVRHLTKEKLRTGQYFVAYCDMAKAHWLQTDKAIQNPYYGKEMLRCGQIIGTL